MAAGAIATARPESASPQGARHTVSLCLQSALVGLATTAILLLSGFDLPFVKDQEAVYAIAVRAMVRGQNLLVPKSGRKPPLYLWAATLISKINGQVTELSCRIPAFIAGGVLAALIFWWCARHLGRRAAWLSWLALLGMGGWVSNYVNVEVDTFLVLGIYAALFTLRPIAMGEQVGFGVAALAVLALAAAILSKGPLALVVVFGSIGLFLIVEMRQHYRNSRDKLALLVRRGLKVAIPGAAAAGLAAIWYVAAAWRDSSGFWSVVMEENVGHFLPGATGGTGEAARPIYFIAAHLIGASLPLVLFIPACLGAMRESDPRLRRVLTYVAMPALFVVVFFSIAASKRESYVLPALPALAIMLGWFFARTERDGDTVMTRRLTMAASAGCAVLAATCLALIAISRTALLESLASGLKLHHADRQLLELFAQYLSSPGWAAILSGTLIVSIWWMSRGLLSSGRPALEWGAFTFAIAASLFWNGALRPALARVRTEKPFLAQIARQFPDAPKNLFVLDQPDVEAEYYLDFPGTIISADGPPPHRPYYLLCWNRDLPREGVALLAATHTGRDKFRLLTRVN